MIMRHSQFLLSEPLIISRIWEEWPIHDLSSLSVWDRSFHIRWRIGLLARDGKLPSYHVLQDKLDTLAKNIVDRYPNASSITHAMDAGDAAGAWSQTSHMCLPNALNMQEGQPLIVLPISPE